MKKNISIILVLILSFSLSACGMQKTEQDSTTQGENIIGLSISTLNNPFFVTLSDSAKSTAKDLGVKLIVLDAGDDTAKQTSDIEDLMSRNINVLIVNPVDSDAVGPAVVSAKDRGIKVISVDREVNGATVDCKIASDNVGGAKTAGEYLISLVGTNAKVAELEGVPGASATIDRGAGFNMASDGKLNVVSRQTANFNRADGLNVMENILQANPDIKGVFCHNDEMALGAVEAVKSSGKDVVIVGFDATDDAISAVENGAMAATVAQRPDSMGKTSVETAVALAKGESVESEIDVEVELITK